MFEYSYISFFSKIQSWLHIQVNVGEISVKEHILSHKMVWSGGQFLSAPNFYQSMMPVFISELAEMG